MQAHAKSFMSKKFESKKMLGAKKLERKKVRISEKVELFSGRTFSSKFFLVHMEQEVLQQWKTTHFKACSNS